MSLKGPLIPGTGSGGDTVVVESMPSTADFDEGDIVVVSFEPATGDASDKVALRHTGSAWVAVSTFGGWTRVQVTESFFNYSNSGLSPSIKNNGLSVEWSHSQKTEESSNASPKFGIHEMAGRVRHNAKFDRGSGWSVDTDGTFFETWIGNRTNNALHHRAPWLRDDVPSVTQRIYEYGNGSFQNNVVTDSLSNPDNAKGWVGRAQNDTLETLDPTASYFYELERPSTGDSQNELFQTAFDDYLGSMGWGFFNFSSSGTDVPDLVWELTVLEIFV